MNLNNKAILITGAKGGLGTFVTTAALDAGALVVGSSRSIASSDFPREGFTAMPAELSNSQNASKLVDAAAALHGRIDGLIHVMGGFAGGTSIADTSDAMLEQMLDINFRSAFYVIRATLAHMRNQGSGRIVAIGSKAGVQASPKAGVYGASKAALLSLIETAAHENRDKHIAINALNPGTMDTPANRAAMPDFNKWIDPAQVAALAVHLMSDQAAQISGASIPVDGAW